MAFVSGLAEVQPQLHDFEIPVAEISPEELVNNVRGFVKAEFGERLVDFSGGGVEAGDDPARLDRARRPEHRVREQLRRVDA